MDIADASTFFDDEPVYDAYTGALLFYGQAAAYDDSTSDGATLRRRVLAVGPTVTIPERRAVKLYGDRWLVGTGTPEGFYGEVVRQNFSMKRATHLMALLTPGEALEGAAGTPAYVHKHYFKEVSNAITNSELDTYWNIFVSPGELISRGYFLRSSDARLYRVRTQYLPAEGLRVLQSDELEPDARTTATFKTGTYNPVLDETTGSSVVVNVIQMDTSKLYRYQHISDPQILKGDVTVVVPTALTPKPNDMFEMGGKQWRVLSVQPEMSVQFGARSGIDDWFDYFFEDSRLDAWMIHARRA